MLSKRHVATALGLALAHPAIFLGCGETSFSPPQPPAAVTSGGRFILTSTGSGLPDALAEVLNENIDATILSTRGGIRLLDNGDSQTKTIRAGFGGTAVEQFAQLLRFQREAGSAQAYPPTTDARDACGNGVWVAFVPTNAYPVLFPNEEPLYWDQELGLREWPSVCRQEPNCNTLESGTWRIEVQADPATQRASVEFRLSPHNVNEPALFGIVNAYMTNRQNGGYSVVPVVLNFQEIRITLSAALSGNGVILSFPVIDGMSISDDLQIETQAFQGCKEHWESRFGTDQNLPWGCEDKAHQSRALALETSSAQGYLMWDTLGSLRAPLLSTLEKHFTYSIRTALACALDLPEPSLTTSDGSVLRFER